MSGLRTFREKCGGLFLHNWFELIMPIIFLRIAAKGGAHALPEGSFQRFVCLPPHFFVGANTVRSGNGHLVH